MSCIVEGKDGKLTAFMKGSPEMIKHLVKKTETFPDNFHSVLEDYTSEGYRVLALAYKDITCPLKKALC
jgi:cation-transporting P-type ATPase 13A3/4/5